MTAADPTERALLLLSLLQTHRFWVTVRLLTDFISSPSVGEFVEGNGEIVGAEDDLFTVRGRIWTGERTIMSATGLFKALGPRPAKPDWIRPGAAA